MRLPDCLPPGSPHRRRQLGPNGDDDTSRLPGDRSATPHRPTSAVGQVAQRRHRERRRPGHIDGSAAIVPNRI